jgi:hypothetical protein
MQRVNPEGGKEGEVLLPLVRGALTPDLKMWLGEGRATRYSSKKRLGLAANPFS